MAAASSSQRGASGNELKLALLIGLSMAVVLLSVWAYNQLVSNNAEEVVRPVPTWLGVSKVRAQTQDGRTLSVQVNFMLKDKEELEILSPYEPVFESLVAQVGSEFNTEQVTGSERILQFGDAVRSSVNDYLNEQHVKPRIKRIAFEEFRLMPS
ncbi:MAG: flagellar basal body-associated FliL family protein [Burkholderiales bacterium]|nr:flagellar basal body-associated FliL family protein [Burkholderiales bacterium]